MMRYNPAVVAEAFASLSLMFAGRVFLGVGSGEALNEQAATGAWPKWPERWERLIEAIEIIRALWAGEQVKHHGKYIQSMRGCTTRRRNRSHCLLPPMAKNRCAWPGNTAMGSLPIRKPGGSSNPNGRRGRPASGKPCENTCVGRTIRRGW
jgi:luciferase-like monooxygenase